MFSDFFLLLLQRQVELPNAEFLFNLGDYPMATDTGRLRNFAKFPIFSWGGEERSNDLLLPSYVMLRWVRESAVEDLHQVDGLSFGVAKWEEKEERLLWRGRDSSRERLRLVEMGKEEEEEIKKRERLEKEGKEEGEGRTRLLDVGIDKYFFFKDREEVLGTVPNMPFFDFWKYKYLVRKDTFSFGA
jgi:hypothetical protein